MQKILTIIISALFVFTLPSFADIDNAYAADSAEKSTDKKKGAGKKEADPDCE